MAIHKKNGATPKRIKKLLLEIRGDERFVEQIEKAIKSGRSSGCGKHAKIENFICGVCGKHIMEINK